MGGAMAQMQAGGPGLPPAAVKPQGAVLPQAQTQDGAAADLLAQMKADGLDDSQTLHGQLASQEAMIPQGLPKDREADELLERLRAGMADGTVPADIAQAVQALISGGADISVIREALANAAAQGLIPQALAGASKTGKRRV